LGGEVEGIDLMSDVSLKSVVMLNQSTAGNGTAYLVDYRWGGMVQRNIVTVSMNAADTITIQGSVDGGVTWVQAATPRTGGTGPFIDTITGPFTHLRIAKTGAGGNALVQGII
jgi:hypothetical protein